MGGEEDKMEQEEEGYGADDWRDGEYGEKELEDMWRDRSWGVELRALLKCEYEEADEQVSDELKMSKMRVLLGY